MIGQFFQVRANSEPGLQRRIGNLAYIKSGTRQVVQCRGLAMGKRDRQASRKAFLSPALGLFYSYSGRTRSTFKGILEIPFQRSYQGL